jgi:hypothetical protein
MVVATPGTLVELLRSCDCVRAFFKGMRRPALEDTARRQTVMPDGRGAVACIVAVTGLPGHLHCATERAAGAPR